MSTIQTISNGETGASCRNKLNTNDTNLNTDKHEDGDSPTYSDLEVTGDLLYSSGGGSIFGGIYVEDSIINTTLNSAAKVQVPTFISNSLSNGVTPDHTNDHITILTDGIYKVNAYVGARNQASQTHDLILACYKNNGTVSVPGAHIHRTLTGGSSNTGAITLSGYIQCSIGDTIELWADTSAAADRIVTFEGANLIVEMVGSV